MFTDQIIVITGASSGIGAEMAKRCAANGARTILAARNADKLREVAAAIDAPCDTVVMDVTSDDSVRRAFADILEKFGRIDVLINNAGFGIFKSFDEMGMSEFTEMMDVNYFGIVRCTKAVLPSMLERGNGHIVNIASIAGKIGSPKGTGYTATKHAVLGLTNSLRMELAGTGVLVSAVNPGPIDTPFFDRADPSGKYLQSMPRGFVLRPERVAQAVLDAVRKKKREVNLPLSAAIGVKLFQMFPGILNRAATKVLDRK